MDDRIRVSDADRDHAAARLRDHFAEGRLTQEELDERISAALSAKTFGDLRRVMADLPQPEPVPARAAPNPQRAGPPWVVYRHGPPILPLVLFALLAAMLIPGGGWLFLKLMLAFWLISCLVGAFAAGRYYRRIRRGRQPGYLPHERR
ncbi:MAG TPA: DUF1707 domain-containing protein [Streptosporangiaceae bacterium]|jgi:DUF1707 SHOCT-like domain